MDSARFGKLLDQLDFSFRRKTPVIHQTESSECGLACLAMVCGSYGKNIDLIALRRRYNISTRGATLAHIKSISEQLGLITRPLSLELHELKALKKPCILHWNFNHFVVLVEMKGSKFILHDPARGRRTLSLNEFSKSFTGVALEVWPGSVFEKDTVRHHLSIRKLAEGVNGLKGSLAKIFCFSLVIEAISLLLPVGTQLIMDHVIPSGDHGLLTLICSGLILFIFLRSFITFIRSWSTLVMSTLINVQWQAGLFTHLLHLPMTYFERRRMGDIQSRFNSINLIKETFTNSLTGALIDGIMVVSVAIMMYVYGNWLFWIVLAFTLAYITIRFSIYHTYRNLSEETLIKDARAKSYFMETLYGIATVKIQGMIGQRQNNWLNLEIDTVNTEIKLNKLDFIFDGLNTLIVSCEQIVILWLGINMIIDHELTIGMFIAFGTFREQFSGRIHTLINFIFKLRMLRLQSERVADIALHELETMKPDVTTGTEIQPLSLETFDLSYSYDTQSSPVFSGLNISVLPGENVAITGPSGTGKSTLMKVLCGLIQPDTGRVIVDGLDIRQLGVNNYQRLIGCVMQEDKLFSGSIRENICGFSAGADEEWMTECARASYIHDFIMSTPMGYETLIGELGEGLSGGQKQRIFIARALYRKPGILFMDEATSALDNDSEKQVSQAIKKLKITRIVIAHRDTTISMADRVITLK
ncbi:peptidase domain-containing ABC transporter [Pantoea ananatis]|uniref:peptidase domain-containing ABC transporter n=1 Tax=Pantoea ananas TaxID=553 RepID=UPI00158E2CA2|nr:peptidase domain-containing ABC transporter [Pantoea ananatis]MBA4824028.1 peptidase domain-containing ABC transporter [Pantoea ananatis]QKV86059.1 peptidase domain-containing ABC transporter [Pantoea ananatis]